MSLSLTRESLVDARQQLLICGIEEMGRLEAGLPLNLAIQAGVDELGKLVRAGLNSHSCEPGSIVLTPALALESQGVRQLAMVVVRPVPTLDELRQALQGLAFHAQQMGYTSLACPALGCGAGALPPLTVAQVVLDVLGPPSRQELQVNLCLPGEREYQAFVQVAQRLRLIA